MQTTIDTQTGKAFRWNTTTVYQGKIVPARITSTTSVHLHPDRVLPELLARLNPPPPDFTFTNHGSLWLVEANTPASRNHLRDNVQHDAHWFGGQLVVEPRYVVDLAECLQAAGFNVTVNN